MSEEFAKVVWTADDILTLRPAWTETQCIEWLERNERRLQERMIETGWQVIEALIDR